MTSGSVRSRSPNLLTHRFSDFGNAQRLIAMYGTRLFYCSPKKKWLVWDGCRYQIDEKDEIRKLAQNTMLEFARQAVDTPYAKFASRCLNSQRLSSAIREAEPRLAILPAELDASPYLLNFKNGSLDLRTFDLLPHRRGDRITKLVHYNYIADATCPCFLAFAERVLGPLVQFLQKALGYSITGLTVEKVIFLCCGPTNTGKTTLLELIRYLFEEYSTLIMVDSLMTRNQEDNNSRADLADLRAVRFAMTSETEEGQRLKEGKLKRLTQGQGLIKTARKYENPIQFPETHKIWVDTNHMPVIHGTDDSIWNRLVPIPFEHPVAPADIDRDLPMKLRAEAEGIIAWIIEGCRRWQQEGLGRVEAVDSTRGRWRGEMDRLAVFRQECCIESPMVRSNARPLYLSYKTRAEEAGERPLTETAFGRRMGEIFEKSTDSKGRVVYHGIALRDEVKDDDN